MIMQYRNHKSDKYRQSIKLAILSIKQKIVYSVASALTMLICSSTILAQDFAPLKSQLQQIITGYKAQVGIAVIIDGKDTLTVNNEEHYPMMSVYKFHQALAVAKKMEQNAISLDTMIYVKKEELHADTYSPLRDKYPEGNTWFSVKELLTYTLQWSDNNACDILFDHIIDPKQTDVLLHRIGGKDFNISTTEREMHFDVSKCFDNWSTPLSSAKLLDDFVAGRIVKRKYYDFILHSMLNCTTGAHRLPTGLPAKVQIGHKTGTSGKDKNDMFMGVNDIGFIFMSENRRFSIAVYVKNSKEDLETNERIIADVSRKVYSFLQKHR